MHDLPLAFSFSDKVMIINDNKEFFFGTPSEALESGIVEGVFKVKIIKNNNYFIQY